MYHVEDVEKVRKDVTRRFKTITGQVHEVVEKMRNIIDECGMANKHKEKFFLHYVT